MNGLPHRAFVMVIFKLNIDFVKKGINVSNKALRDVRVRRRIA